MISLTARLMLIGSLAAGCTVLAFLPAPQAAPATAMPALALTVFTVAMLATNAMPEYLATTIFFAIAAIAALSPLEVIFAGFHSNVLWLVFGGLVVGAAAERTGLGRWLAQFFIRGAGGSHVRLIAAIVVGSGVLAFIIPATVARFTITLPVVAVIAKEAGYPVGSPAYFGTILAAIFGGFFISLGILPSNLGNVLLAGVAESLFGTTFTYGEYLVMNFPVQSILKGLFIIAAISVLYKPEGEPQSFADNEHRPLSPEGRQLAMVLIFALIAWSTDFVHGVAPGWIALVAAIICMLPGIDLLPAREFAERVNLVTILYLAGILGIAAVLAKSGAGDLVSAYLGEIAAAEGRSQAYGYYAVSYMSAAIPLLTTSPGSTAVMTPVAGNIAEVTDGLTKTMIMAQVNGMAAVIFPYTSLPLMVGLAMAGVPVIRALKLFILMAAVTMIVLVPINYLWWRVLGYLP